MRRSTALLLLLSLVAACGHAPLRSPPAYTHDRQGETYEKVVRWPSPSVTTVMFLANDYLATRRHADGRNFFCERARAVPDRPLFLALCGVFEASMARDVPLLSRAAWVEGALAKLDRAAAADGLSRFLRALVAARLPDRFGRARQAREDLTWAAAEPRLPEGMRRGARAVLAGGPGTQPLLTNFSVNARDGFRFGAPELVEVAQGIWVAHGYDFADIAFVLTGDRQGVVAIDAGTSEPTAAAALAAFRRVSDRPIRAVIVTHAHWDHIGGLRALVGPGTQVIAQAGFAGELRVVNETGAGFRWFFGDGTPAHLELAPQHTVAAPETIVIGETRFSLHPVHGGETDDALLVELPERGVLFAGDAFMPYLGAPQLPEGSAEGLFATIELVRSLRPRLLVHGHTPLTQYFTVDVLEPLDAALKEVHRRTLAGIAGRRTLPEILDEDVLPEGLAAHPDAVWPFLLMRDNFIARVYHQRSGYWKPDGEGLEIFSRGDWGAALDLVAGGDAGKLENAASALVARGDFAMARQVAELGLTAHPKDAALAAARRRALEGLRAQHQFNPFKFIIYSEMAGIEQR